MTRVTGGLALMLLPLLVNASELPNFTAHYTVLRDDTAIGTRTISFSRQAQHYRFDSELSAQGIASLLAPNPVKEHSEGIIDNDRLLVEHYRRDDGNQPKKNMQLDVDNGLNIVHSHTPQPFSYNFNPVLRDPLNELLGFMYQANGANTMVYSIADDDGPDNYHLERLDQTTIKTDAGDFQAVQYRRTRPGKQDRFTLIWCAPSLRYLPVRIEHHKKGNVSTMTLNMLEGL